MTKKRDRLLLIIGFLNVELAFLGKVTVVKTAMVNSVKSLTTDPIKGILQTSRVMGILDRFDGWQPPRNRGGTKHWR